MNSYDFSDNDFSSLTSRQSVRTIATPRVPAMSKTFQYGKLQVILKTGDIADESADVIVNAANEWLENGAGVTGAIFNAASDEFIRASATYGYCPPGHAVLVGNSQPSKLRCKGVIHGVCKPWHASRATHCRVLTAEMYEQCFLIAENATFTTIAFPAMGTGVYSVPVEEAAKMAYKAIDDFINYAGFRSLKEVRFVLFDTTTYHIYKSLFQDWIEQGGN